MKKSFIAVSFCLSIFSGICFGQGNPHPNVIIIITDDQGYGDLGITGNPHVQTPVIDKFAAENIRFNNFYVSPVCAPTRSSLMTGRYSLRTGIRDTYNGGATMASNEVTIAEMLKQADYRTGIFGKWHLGDNYPSRPGDQGFDESLIHLAGGMGQVGDVTNYFKGDSSYFDPVLWHNNTQEAYEGYCSDIFTEQAIDFIEENQQVPFFCYLSFNAPHTPLQVPDRYYQLYKDIDPASGFENDNRPFVEMSEKNKEDARKVYAMVTNIDDNMGRLLQKLEDLNIADNTLVIFMTDNGPQQTRYVGGMRGRKGSVFQGGVRVPFYMRYPALFEGGKDIEIAAAHFDILPTLSQLCNVELPEKRTIDGKSLLPLMKGEQVDWADRELFFYWTRRYPELYNNIALQKEGYKLVGMTDYNAEIEGFELFNIQKDPYEQNNIVLENRDRANDLKKDLDKIYKELISSDNLINPPRIIVGSDNENPVILNRNDADGQRGIWAQEEIFGKWNVSINEGTYNFRFKFIKPIEDGGRMFLETKGIINQKQNDRTNTDIIEMNDVFLPKMDCELIPFYSVNGKRIFPFWLEIERISAPDKQTSTSDLIDPTLNETENLFLNKQAEALLSQVNKVLENYPPDWPETAARHSALLLLDGVLHDVYAPQRPPVQEFLKARIRRAVDEIELTEITDGARIWKLYNHGFVVRTKSVTIGFDLVSRKSAGIKGFSIENEDLDRLIEQCDVLFISHFHDDHAEERVAQSFIDQGKPVVAPPEIWKDKAIYAHITHLERKPHSEQILPVQGGQQELKVVVYPGHQGVDIENNVSLVITPEGLSFSQMGDQSNEDDFEWIDEVANHHVVDVLMPNCWTTDIARVAKGFDPSIIITGHENEMGHTIDHREPYWLTYQRREGSDRYGGSRDVAYDHPLILMTWGESYYFKRENFSE